MHEQRGRRDNPGLFDTALFDTWRAKTRRRHAYGNRYGHYCKQHTLLHKISIPSREYWCGRYCLPLRWFVGSIDLHHARRSRRSSYATRFSHKYYLCRKLIRRNESQLVFTPSSDTISFRIHWYSSSQYVLMLSDKQWIFLLGVLIWLLKVSNVFYIVPILKDDNRSLNRFIYTRRKYCGKFYVKIIFLFTISFVKLDWIEIVILNIAQIIKI